MLLSRRQLLITGSATVFAPCLATAQAAEGITLIAEKSQMLLVKSAGAKTPVWRFSKDQPTTILRAKRGMAFTGKIINRLDEEIWLHWFGVRGPADMMTLNVLPGEANAVDFVFTPPDAGTFWFGPMTKASAQRDNGLYGMLIVEATVAEDFTDVPLIFDDWKLDDSGKPAGKFDDLDDAIGEGRLGNWFTTNGAFRPHIKVDAGKPARLRLLNVANARVMELTLKGADVFLASLDGQPVSIKPADVIVLAPGQRADLMLPALRQPLTVSLGLAEDSVDLAVLESSSVFIPHDLPDNFALAANPLPTIGDTATALQATITIAGGAKGGLKSATVGEGQVDMRGLLEQGLAWAFNGIAGVGGPTLFDVKSGTTVVLTFDNITTFSQPLHIHGHVWKVIESDGQPRDAEPWRDTLVVSALSKVKVVLVAGSPGTWPIQSLIAERVDAGLIGAFGVSA